MKVLFATSELTPIVKVGGLGDVAGALPPALARLGIDIRVIIPKYDTIDEKLYPLKLFKKDVPVVWGNKKEMVNVFIGKIPNSKVSVYFLENKRYLTGGGVYFEKSAFVGSFKEIERFLFFSLAVLQVLPYLDFEPEILHCQDWHTAVLPLLLKIQYGEVRPPIRRSNLQDYPRNPQGEAHPRNPQTLFTIHNLANQGKWNAKEIFNFLGLKGDEHPNLGVTRPGPYGQELSLIEQGILAADLINTVSPTYAQEILTKEYSEGLEVSLGKRQKDLYGILNGIDINRFNPAIDPVLKTTYDSRSLERRIENKLDLQKSAGFPPNPQTPLLGFIGRLTNQKGIELLPPILSELVRLNVKLVVLGTGNEKYETIAQRMAQNYPRNVFVKIGFDAELAQQIYAGCDIFLMPSRFEPCGLGQMIAMRYGTVPIVRATGGLKDTVEKYKTKIESLSPRWVCVNRQRKTKIEGTGFRFEKYDSQKLLQTINQALNVYKDKVRWRQLMINGMKKDFSWGKSAGEYLKLYKKLL